MQFELTSALDIAHKYQIFEHACKTINNVSIVQ